MVGLIYFREYKNANRKYNGTYNKSNFWSYISSITFCIFWNYNFLGILRVIPQFSFKVKNYGKKS